MEKLNAIIRPVRSEDIKRSLVWRNNLDTKARAMSYRLPVTELMEQRWIEEAMSGDKNRIVFAIDEAENNTHVGFADISEIDYFNRNAHYSILIGDNSFRGKGIASAAVKQVLSYAFNELNLVRIYTEIAADNEPSLNFHLKLGFKKEGIQRKHLYQNGVYLDKIAVGMLKEEFKTL